MKLETVRYNFEEPALAIIPETDYEAAILNRHWERAKLTKGKASSEHKSADGFSYIIKFGDISQST